MGAGEPDGTAGLKGNRTGPGQVRNRVPDLTQPVPGDSAVRSSQLDGMRFQLQTHRTDLRVGEGLPSDVLGSLVVPRQGSACVSLRRRGGHLSNVP